MKNTNGSTRRDIVIAAGRLASAGWLASLATPIVAGAEGPEPSPTQTGTKGWDLSWVKMLATATDRAVFDWPSLDDPADPLVLEFAERYLNNCETAYAPRKYEARAVLNIRTRAVPAALNDAMWQKYSLGTEYTVNDPLTKKPATQNPFWHRAPEPVPGIVLPTLADLLGRGAIFLVCDFALGHLSDRLAKKMGGKAEDVHEDLRHGFIPGAFAVPSGIFGLAKAQNAGCAYVRIP